LTQICSEQLFERSAKISFAAITFILTISDHDTSTTPPWLATLKKHRLFPLALPQTHANNSQSMLYRFREQQAAERGLIDTGSMRRPKVITQVDSIPVCEKWRGQVIRQISRAVTKIQDPSLSDYQIRDLNDDINRFMKEKYVWEVQLRNLGGPNYGVGTTGKVVDDEGREVPGQRGYRYYGRARELPGMTRRERLV
jgi:hypothetical protein